MNLIESIVGMALNFKVKAVKLRPLNIIAPERTGNNKGMDTCRVAQVFSLRPKKMRTLDERTETSPHPQVL
ncbi:MAG: hypothetical protein ABI651_19585 [Verrucomicrobiota bacterium]